MHATARQRKHRETSASPTIGAVEFLLRIKLVVPPASARLIPRKRQDVFLRGMESARVTVVSAPSGYGKTTAAAACARALMDSARAVAWLSLEADDDDPARYLRYLAAALADAMPALRSLLADAGAMPPRALLSALINALAESDEPLYLFVDNYGVVSHPGIADAMHLLLRHGPRALRVILVCRGEPRLPLGLPRAEGAVFDIGAADLCFDFDETCQYLTQEGLSLEPRETRLLLDKTDGWIAALCIACHNLRETTDPRAALRALSGGSRHIGGWLDEMLATIPAATRDMMLRTSILERFCASLCEAVANTDNARPLLDSLASNYRLVIAVDENERWFRHQPLIAEYLRDRLQREYPGQQAALHRRAAEWHAAQGMWREAIAHAIAAGDREQAATWIEQNAVDALQRGDLLDVIDWYRRFRDAAPRFAPGVRLNIALAHLLAARQEEAEDMLMEVEAHIGDQPPAARAHLEWQCRVLRTMVAAICRDDTERALALALDCLAENHDDPWLAGAAENVARFCHAKRGDLIGVRSLPWQSGTDFGDKRFVFQSIYSFCFLAMTEMAQLDFHAAERNCRKARALARERQGDKSAVLAVPVTFLAETLYEQDRVDDAEALLVPRLDQIHATGVLDVILSAHRVLARIALLRGNIDHAYVVLEQGENIGHVHGWGRLRAAMLAERLRMVLGEGRLLEASACLAQLRRIAADHPVTSRCAWSQIHDLLGLSSGLLLCHQGDTTAATDQLQQLAAKALEENQPYLLLRARTALAIACVTAGDHDRAGAEFSAALKLGAHTGVSRSIVDSGPELGTLLEQACARGTGEPVAYAARLLAAWRRQYPTGAAPEPLSPRERGVLELVAAGQSNKQIAKTLGIAPETVKTHLKKSFAKLGVGNRAQAVMRLNALPRS